MDAKTKIIVSLAVVSVFAITAVSGVTYAYLEDSHNADVDITTGKCNVKLKDYEIIEKNEIGGKINVHPDYVYITGTLKAGSYVTLSLEVYNDCSNINFKWMIYYELPSAFASRMSCKLVDDTTGLAFNKWSDVVKPNEQDLVKCKVKIEVLQDLSPPYTSFGRAYIYVKSQQANLPSDTIEVNNATDLLQVANGLANHQNQYDGKTIRIMKDMDMSGMSWPKIELNGDKIKNLKITTDGELKTISNLNDLKSYNIRGFITSATNMESLIIDNLAFTNFFCQAMGNAGALVGSLDDCKKVEINSCQVKDSNIQGFFAGGIVGAAIGGTNLSFINCKVSDIIKSNNKMIQGSELTETGGAGGIIGKATDTGKTKFINCTVSNCDIHYQYNKSYYTGTLMGIIGSGEVYYDNCSYTNNRGDTDFNNNYTYGHHGGSGKLYKGIENPEVEPIIGKRDF